MKTYKIIRCYLRDDEHETITRGLTLEQARQHCRDSETASKTATSPFARELTERRGPWFDGYEEE